MAVHRADITYSHKRVREMEHELFQSELKPSVDGTLISSMIRSSSSGLNSHRAAAMVLILEGSIQDCRERMLMKAKNSLRLDPAPQPKSEAPSDTTGKGIETGRGEGQPPGVAIIPSPPGDFVELVCSVCNVKQPRSRLRRDLGCDFCLEGWYMECVGCGAVRYSGVDACTSCHGKFK